MRDANGRETMSYDLEIGAHAKPSYEQVEAWAADQDLVVERDDDGSAVISRRSTRTDGYLFSVDGPFSAEADDFAEEVAAACLAPRWMITVAVPYSVPKRAITLGRSLSRYLAEANDGAAFDPQEDSLIWPKGREEAGLSAPGRGGDEPCDASVVPDDDELGPGAGDPAAPHSPPLPGGASDEVRPVGAAAAPVRLG